MGCLRDNCFFFCNYFVTSFDTLCYTGLLLYPTSLLDTLPSLQTCHPPLQVDLYPTFLNLNLSHKSSPYNLDTLLPLDVIPFCPVKLDPLLNWTFSPKLNPHPTLLIKSLVKMMKDLVKKISTRPKGLVKKNMIC